MVAAVEPTPTSTFYKLPPEIIDNVLDNVPASQLQSTSYSVMQVFPDLAISKAHLFRHLHVTQAKQIKPLWYRLLDDKEKNNGLLVAAVQTFTMASWRGDADIMNNVLRMLPEIQVMMLNLGTNVAPEHLSDCFQKPRSAVERIELRFRPYVDRASYLQFLKGSYFDNALEEMSKKWPESPNLTHLAFVQDVPPRFANPHLLTMMERLTLREADGSVSPAAVMGETEFIESTPIEPRGYTGHSPFPYLGDKLAYTKPKTFAQPICFFDMGCMSRLGRAPAARHITHLRLRVPTRDIAKVLSETGDTRVGRSTFPSLRYLDISTTNVRLDGWLPSLMRRYERLETLILDRTNLFGFLGLDAGPDLCRELGKICVMTGLTRGKEREREIAAWDLLQRREMAEREKAARLRPPPRPQSTENSDAEDGSGEDGSRSEGEEGHVAPEPSSSAGPVVAPPVPSAVSRLTRRRNHRSIAMSTISLRERPLRDRRAAAAAPLDLEIAPPYDLHLVLPPLPRLRSICIGGEAVDLEETTVEKWDAAYHEGWREGLEKVEDWASRQCEKYERAVKAAKQWHVSEEQERMRLGGKQGKGSAPPPKKGAAPVKAKVRPPLDIHLYRYPLPGEMPGPLSSSDNPLEGLIEVFPGEGGEDWRAPYDAAMEAADAQCAAAEAGAKSAELYGRSQPPQVVVCMVPDCEGPIRRGEEGQREDGRSGMVVKDGKLEETTMQPHAPGCGHMLGRRTWGWREG